MWGVHEWESNFLFKAQATSPLKSRRWFGEGVIILQQIFLGQKRLWTVFEDPPCLILQADSLNQGYGEGGRSCTVC